MKHVIEVPGGGEFMQWEEIHKSSTQSAREAYLKEYGIDYHDDPQWEIGNDRHTFWLNAYDERQKALIINPRQN